MGYRTTHSPDETQISVWSCYLSDSSGSAEKQRELFQGSTIIIPKILPNINFSTSRLDMYVCYGQTSCLPSGERLVLGTLYRNAKINKYLNVHFKNFYINVTDVMPFELVYYSY